jgi:hypothetical protein
MVHHDLRCHCQNSNFLATQHRVKQTSCRALAAQADIAAKAIDSLTVEAPDDEKASRKRRLLKGPEEFGEVRVV